MRARKPRFVAILAVIDLDDDMQLSDTHFGVLITDQMFPAFKSLAFKTLRVSPLVEFPQMVPRLYKAYYRVSVRLFKLSL